MNFKLFPIAIFLALVGISSGGLRSGFYQCPDDSKAVNEVGDIQKDVPGVFLGFVTLDIRIPESGLLSAPITCIMATDLAMDGEGGTVTVVNGGIGSKYVELKIVSQFLRGLKYRVQVFTNQKTYID